MLLTFLLENHSVALLYPRLKFQTWTNSSLYNFDKYIINVLLWNS